MTSEDRGPASVLQERRHRVAHERAGSAPTIDATTALPTERTEVRLRVQPDRRRMVIAIDPSIERRRHPPAGRR